MSNTTIPKDAREVWEMIDRFSDSVLSDNGLSAFKLMRNITPVDKMLAEEREYAIALIESYAAEHELIAREETARKCAEAARKALDKYDHGYIVLFGKRFDMAEFRAAIMDAAKGEGNE